MADAGHFGILRELTSADHGAERKGPPEGPVKAVLDVLKKERNGEIAYKGLLYRVVAAGSFHAKLKVKGTEFAAVDPADAETLLQEMAGEARGAPAVKKALEEAARFVDKPGTRASDKSKSLILLREVRGGGGSAPEEAPKPAPKPKRPPASSSASDEEPEIRLVNVEAATFVPGVETTKIMYAIDGPVAKTASVTMIVRSVPAKGDPSIVERMAIDGPYSASGSVDWEGKASTPGGLITLKGSPYEIRFELVSKSGKQSTSNVGKIKLEVKETKVVVDDTGPLDVPDDWKTTVAAFITELKNSGMPGDCEGRVIIESPLFKVSSGLTGDMYTDASFTTYQGKAGLGPTLPFLAQIKLKAKDGSGKRSAPVLIGTRVLWDFKLETSGDLDGSLGARGVQAVGEDLHEEGRRLRGGGDAAQGGVGAPQGRRPARQVGRPCDRRRAVAVGRRLGHDRARAARLGGVHRAAATAPPTRSPTRRSTSAPGAWPATRSRCARWSTSTRRSTSWTRPRPTARRRRTARTSSRSSTGGASRSSATGLSARRRRRSRSRR